MCKWMKGEENKQSNWMRQRRKKNGKQNNETKKNKKRRRVKAINVDKAYARVHIDIFVY